MNIIFGYCRMHYSNISIEALVKCMAETTNQKNPTEKKMWSDISFVHIVVLFNSAKRNAVIIFCPCTIVMAMDGTEDHWKYLSMVFLQENYSATNSRVRQHFCCLPGWFVWNGDILPGHTKRKIHINCMMQPGIFSLLTDRIQKIVFSTTGDCNGIAVPGSHPCTAIPIDTGQCILSDNTGFAGSGINAGCASYNGGDVWFLSWFLLPGSVSVATDSGSIGDTGSIWTDSSCTNLRSLGCDDDGNSNSNGYFSLIFYVILIRERWYTFRHGAMVVQQEPSESARDLGKINLDSTELPIVMINTLGQTIVENTKINALMDVKYNGPVVMTYLSDSANEYSGSIGIELRGASSLAYPQHSYGIETRTSSGSNNNVPILDMPADNDWALISNYNDRSLVRNVLAYRLFEQMEIMLPEHACAKYWSIVYTKGYTFVWEKIKRDQNRVKIIKLTTADSTGDELTGGYILQQNYWDANNSFQSNYSRSIIPDLMFILCMNIRRQIPFFRNNDLISRLM